MLAWLCVLQDRLHGGSLRWWVWVEDPVLNRLHHAEAWTLTKKVYGKHDKLELHHEPCTAQPAEKQARCVQRSL